MTDLDRFTEWLNNEQMISMENVKIGFFEETGRGIMAAKDINVRYAIKPRGAR